MSLVETLRSGEFLTRERLRLWAVALLIGYAFAIGYLFATAHGLNDYQGRPLGTDFSDIYTAGRAALHGDALSPFDPAQQYRHEQEIFGRTVPFFGWHYPPFFLLVAAPLAALAYVPSLIVWQLGTLALYLVSLWWLLRTGPNPEIARDKIWIVLALAFPAVFMNVTHGHNGFLTAALLAGALATLNKRPVLAGVLFGLMVYKPQFGILIPVALLAGRHWATIVAATVTVGVLAALTTFVFGAEVWHAFVGSLAFTRTAVLEQGGAGFFKIQSVFAAVRMWGGPIPLAYTAQALVTVGSGTVLYRLWCSHASPARKGAALCLASVIATPYCFDYDMMALAPAIALLAAEGLADGFRLYERVLIAALWGMPLVARSVAQYTGIPLGAALMLVGLAILAFNPLRVAYTAKHPDTHEPMTPELLASRTVS
ncbi:MAG: glycosyltransferase family 87 protein [Alphaproteobacteria bacterium]|jgi:alpha-1,2-mannosyltransferase